MIKMYRAISGLALGCFMAGKALPQGVPIVDLAQHLQHAINNGIQQNINNEAQDHNIRRDDLTSLHQDQLDAIDEAIEAMNDSDFSPAEFENYSGAPVDAAYNTDILTGAESRIFGDGRLTIEKMIVETVQNHQGHPALANAGIAPVGFRAWFQALVKQESGFQVRVCSHAGACGLTQIMPGTFDYLGIPPSQRDDPRIQLDGGARYLLMQLNTFGTMPLALAAYNAGPGAVHNYGGIPPYAETQDYVVKITKYANEYAAAMGSSNDLGTLSSTDMAMAEFGNMADAGMMVGASMASQLKLSARRVRAIIERIPETENVREAIELNTYLRAEITRLASMITLMEAAQRQVEHQRFAAIYQAQIEDENFLTISAP